MDYNITHVINVSEEIGNYFPDDMDYLRISVSDTNDASLESYFGRALRFIEEADGSNVFISVLWVVVPLLLLFCI